MARAPLAFHSRYALMAKRPLKVFRTSTGFQDAYVAVTSRKAALEAWGTDKDLFAAGAAELVTDAKLTKAALAQPGVVIRTARGTTAQHLAAAGKVRKTATRREAPDPEAAEGFAAPPKPSRAKLERAEAALERKEQQLSSALADIDAQIKDLRRQREGLRSRLGADIK
ncbi:hypothetical protein [Sphingobium sp. ZW T5_29]|uniref:hypothetical protein n=1 Tax=Sphingobium sp. ZW T5_29 TaxID=3378077 RepID=UPI003851DC2D